MSRRSVRGRACVVVTVIAASVLGWGAATLAAAAVPTNQATIINEALQPLYSGGSTTQFGLSLPAQQGGEGGSSAASCANYSQSNPQQLDSYLVPEGTDPSTVTFSDAGPSTGGGLFANGSYYGFITIVGTSGQLPSLPDRLRMGAVADRQCPRRSATSRRGNDRRRLGDRAGLRQRARRRPRPRHHPMERPGHLRRQLERSQRVHVDGSDPTAPEHHHDDDVATGRVEHVGHVGNASNTSNTSITTATSGSGGPTTIAPTGRGRVRRSMTGTWAGVRRHLVRERQYGSTATVAPRGQRPVMRPGSQARDPTPR